MTESKTEPAEERAGRSRGGDGGAFPVEHVALKEGIRPATEFEKKGLASYAVNVGIKCGHDCLYCSTGTMVRHNPAFKKARRSPFEHGYAIVDPGAPERVARDAAASRGRGVVQLCTIADAWSPEAQEYNLGRRCLDALLREPGWEVRVLTKGSAVRADFDLIEEHRDRVRVGLSLTAVPSKQAVIAVVEPRASPIAERVAALQDAHDRGRAIASSHILAGGQDA